MVMTSESRKRMHAPDINPLPDFFLKKKIETPSPSDFQPFQSCEALNKERA